MTSSLKSKRERILGALFCIAWPRSRSSGCLGEKAARWPGSCFLGPVEDSHTLRDRLKILSSGTPQRGSADLFAVLEPFPQAPVLMFLWFAASSSAWGIAHCGFPV
jgi:hypothetical protein